MLRETVTDLVTVTLHVAEGVLVSVDDDEAVLVELDLAAHVEVGAGVVVGHLCAERGLVGLLDAASLQELAPDNTWREREKNHLVMQRTHLYYEI